MKSIEPMEDKMEKKILADKMFILWELMAKLEAELWDIFPDEFVDRCLDHLNKPEHERSTEYPF